MLVRRVLGIVPMFLMLGNLLADLVADRPSGTRVSGIAPPPPTRSGTPASQA
jgi:hypothetical protein